MLQSLPEDTGFEDSQYHLYVLEKIRFGIERAEIEGALSHENAQARLSRWLTG